MATITRIIQKQIYEKLEEEIPGYFNNIGLTEPRIKMGNLQDDPEAVSASFMVHIQDPDDSTVRDVPIKSRSNELVADSSTNATYGTVGNQLFSAGRIGGGRTWAKFYTVEIIQFATGLEQDDAADLCYSVVEFTCDVLKSVNISDLTDGIRTGVSIKIDSVRAEESGGPPTDYNWTAYIRMIAEVIDRSG